MSLYAKGVLLQAMVLYCRGENNYLCFFEVLRLQDYWKNRMYYGIELDIRLGEIVSVFEGFQIGGFEQILLYLFFVKNLLDYIEYGYDVDNNCKYLWNSKMVWGESVFEVLLVFLNYGVKK